MVVVVGCGSILTMAIVVCWRCEVVVGDVATTVVTTVMTASPGPVVEPEPGPEPEPPPDPVPPSIGTTEYVALGASPTGEGNRGSIKGRQ